MKLASFIILAFSLGLSFNGSAQKLPDNWTHVMKLEASYHGGMSQYSFHLVITDTLSTMTEITHKGRKVYKKTFTPKELNTLLAFLKTYRFDQIKSKLAPGITNDKGTESVMLSWDYNVLGASESASSNLQEEYEEDFEAIQRYVKGLFRKE